jgi:tRNA(Ile)-lysidine synthase
MLVKYCYENGIPSISDPSNTNEDYLRPRLRGAMQILAKEGLTSKRLAVTSRRLSRARLALDQLAEKTYEESLLVRNENFLVIDFDFLKQQPEEIGLRVLQRMIETLRPVSEYGVRMEKLEELFSSLWHSPQSYKPRTLGKCKISLKNDKTIPNQALWVEKE